MKGFTVLAHLLAFFFNYQKTCHIYRKTILGTKYVFHVFVQVVFKTCFAVMYIYSGNLVVDIAGGKEAEGV